MDSALSITVAAIGFIVIALTIWDIGGSLLGDGGNGGVVTGRMTSCVWRSLESSRRRGRHLPSHIAGRSMVLAIPVTWLASMWVGWSLIFTSGIDNVVASATQAAASTPEKLYFVGYLLATLGNGEFQPSGTGWQAASVLTTMTGFAVLTLGVTYVVPVVQAASSRRTTARMIALHGSTTSDLRKSLESGEFDSETIAQQIVTLAEKHGSFPVLHYLHTHDEIRSAPAMIARLALAAEEVDIDKPLQRALDGYRQFHPAACGATEKDVWIQVLRSDGRTVSEACGQPSD